MSHFSGNTNKKKRGIAFRIFRAVLIAVVAVILGAIILIIGIRNYKAIKGRIHGPNGIDEEGYIDLCGQEQYYLIRGEDVSNPVIIWIHGGPASPDTMETYTFSNYLKDDYTVVAWNQRGCGRTYYKNKEKDPDNDTATFEQTQADLDALTSPYLGIYDVLWFTKQLGNLSDFMELNRQLFDYISMEDVYAYGTEYQVPVGFISGSCDWTAPVKYTEDYFNVITAPKKKMQLIDGWGHNVPLESPKEFAETLMQVLDEILNEIMQ